jgi:hypothetical protein
MATSCITTGIKTIFKTDKVVLMEAKEKTSREIKETRDHKKKLSLHSEQHIEKRSFDVD